MQTEMQNLITKDYYKNKFNGALLVADRGEIVCKQAWGWANLEWEQPNTVDTRFKIASLTKPFTALLTLMLIQEGLFSLNSTLADVLPYYRQDTGNQITIHHLLTHTSGIPSYTNLPNFIDKDIYYEYSPKDFIENFCMNDLNFKPGKQFEYNNSGYYLLGGIIEEATDLDYSTALQKYIFDPVDMNDTGYYRTNQVIKRLACNYIPTDMGHLKEPYINETVMYSTGGLYSTVSDLYKWNKTLDTDDLLDAPFRKMMFSSYKGNYGYGWGIVTAPLNDLALMLQNPSNYTCNKEGLTLARHEGGHPGCHALMLRFFDKSGFIVLVSNMGEADLHGLSAKIATILYDK